MTRTPALSLLCWFILALVATPCFGARAALDGQDPTDRGRADEGQLGTLRLRDDLLLVRDGEGGERKSSSGPRGSKSAGARQEREAERSGSTTTATTNNAPRRNAVLHGSRGHHDDHPRPLHRHNDLFEPPLERRGRSSSRDRQRKDAPPAAGDLQGGLHNNQRERGRTSRNLRGGEGKP